MNESDTWMFDSIEKEAQQYDHAAPVEPEADYNVTAANHEEPVHQPQVEPVAWPSWLGKYGRLGVKGSDPRVYNKGEAVELLLSRAGWKGDEFTEEFANEVKQIQEENNLAQTGRVDQKTWNVIVNK